MNIKLNSFCFIKFVQINNQLLYREKKKIKKFSNHYYNNYIYTIIKRLIQLHFLFIFTLNLSISLYILHSMYYAKVLFSRI